MAVGLRVREAGQNAQASMLVRVADFSRLLEGSKLADNPLHPLVTAPVAVARCGRGLIRDYSATHFVEPHKLPANLLSAGATPARLPTCHDLVTGLRNPDRVNFHATAVAVILEFKNFALLEGLARTIQNRQGWPPSAPGELTSKIVLV